MCLTIDESGLNIIFKASEELFGDLSSIYVHEVMTLGCYKGDVDKISMPRVLVYKADCVRIQAITPGYDDYIYLPPGKYDIGLELYCLMPR